MKKLVKESLNEIISFEREKNPLSTLGIGQSHLISSWLDKMEIEGYGINNNDLTIDVKNSVNLYYQNLKEFPEYIQFNKIYGYFNCDDNMLISLKGGPKYVKGSFRCNSNELSSLKYCPQYVGISFWCQDNKVQFTKEDVKKLCIVKRVILT